MTILMALENFIENHLSQNCVSMVGHIQANELLPIISRYIENQNNYPPEHIIKLRVKLFDYHSCMRNFEIGNYLQAEIQNQLANSNENFSMNFFSEAIGAQYLIACAYQYRNYKPTENFALSEENFMESEKIILKLLGRSNKTSDQEQTYVNLLFNERISRFWLYSQYMKDYAKAKNLLQIIDESLTVAPTNVRAYFTAYYFFVGCHYLAIKDYANSVLALDKAVNAIATENSVEAGWFLERLTKPIQEKRAEAKEKYSDLNRSLSIKFVFTPSSTDNKPAPSSYTP